MSEPLTKKSISTPLLRWYDVHARELPWRISPADRKKGVQPDPYRVWLSEIMLQQTTVATVTPRYDRFLERWPNVEAMAASPVEDILSEWAGLGYYARARNLHKCAVRIAEGLGGIFPQTVEALEALPGIGPYTAAAIASIAFDQPAVVMDGNIERVMARLFAIETPLPDAKPALKECATLETPKKRPGDHAQALMDLGATICTPRKPACGICPLLKKCAAQKQGIQEILPKKKKKAAKPMRHGACFLIRRQGDEAYYLIRRPEKGLLGGMIAPPSTEWSIEKQEIQLPFKGKWKKSDHLVRHTFTHFHLELEVWEITVPTSRRLNLQGEWVVEPSSAGLPTVFKKAFMADRG